MLERDGFRHADVEGSFVDLVAAGPDQARVWIRRRARLADGDPITGAGVIDPDARIAAEHQLEVLSRVMPGEYGGTGLPSVQVVESVRARVLATSTRP